MLTGEDFQIFHKYVESIMGRPVYTHEMGDPRIANEIKEKSTNDFLLLCQEATPSNSENPNKCEDAISRQAAIDAFSMFAEYESNRTNAEWVNRTRIVLSSLPSVTPKQRTGWIPVSERLPEDLEAVNITWVNHEPEPYYKEIKDKPFTATGVYFNGQWYWWSTLCTDTLAEYSHNFYDVIDTSIEVIAWMPLPEPYKEEGETDDE